MSNLKKGSTIDGKVILTEPDLPVQKAGDQLLFGEHTVYTTGNKPSNEDVGSMPIAGGTFTGKVTTKEINVPVGQKATFGAKSSIEEAKDGSLIVSSNNVKVGVDASTVLTKDSITSNSINANTELKEKGNRVYSQNNTTNDKNGFVRLFGNAETALKSELDKVASDLANIDLTSIIVQNPGKNANVAMSQNATTIELDKKVNSTTQVIAGNGLSGGGTLASNRTITLGTPTKITATSTNSVTTTSHTHEIDKASTTVAGIVQLNNTVTSTSTAQAATANAAKLAYDRADLGVKNAATAQARADLGVTNAANAHSRADSAYNLAQTKQDKLTFVGNGSEVMKTGAFGLGSLLSVPGNDLNNAMRPGFYQWLTDCSNAPVDFGSAIVTSWDGIGWESAEQFTLKNGNAWIRGKNNASSSWTSWIKLLTESDRTSSLGASTTLVATQKLVNDVSIRTTAAQSRADSAHSLAESKTTEEWVKSQGYITASSSVRLSDVKRHVSQNTSTHIALSSLYETNSSGRGLVIVRSYQRSDGKYTIEYQEIIG